MNSDNLSDYMSPEGVETLKSLEGFSSVPYADGKNGQSEGYGVRKDLHPELATKTGELLTKEEATKQMGKAIVKIAKLFIAKIGRTVWDAMNQGQRDATLMCAYNMGAQGAFDSFGRCLIERDWEGAEKKIRSSRTTGHHNGKVVDLSRRRQQEADLFRKATLEQ